MNKISPSPMSLPAELAVDELARRLRLLPAAQQNEDLLQSILLELEVRQYELELRNRDLWQAHQHLLQTCDRYANLYDRAPVTYLTLDEAGVIRQINMSGVTFFGAERDALIGKSLANWLEPGCLAAFQAHLARCLKEGVEERIALCACIPGRGKLEAELRSIPLCEKNETRVLAVLVEVPHSELLIPSARAEFEGVNRAKNTFLANMSHEIRTPVGAILGITDFLLDERDIPADERRQWARRLRHNGEWLLKVIDDILDLALIESGRVRISTAAFNLQVLINEVVEFFREEAAQKGITLHFQVSPDAPQTLVSDVKRVRQILLKLVGNALKFTEAGEVKVSLLPKGDNRADVIIHDTGVGISPEAQQKIFQTFFQGDDSPSRRFGGAGLGLALAWRWTALLGGELRLNQSAVGQGSEFLLQLPLQPPALTPEPLPVETPPEDSKLRGNELRGSRILLVEDVPDNQLIMKIYLERAGASVEIASDGGEGVYKALSDDFDLILMDIQMSGVDGIEATRRLRGTGYDRPIIALTAHAFNGEREKSLAVGFDDHLSKPIQPVKLVRCIQSRLSH